MPLTNPAVGADLYVALEEQAIRCVIETVMYQRPLLFNYATQGFIERPDLMYQPIAAHPAVIAKQYPVITPMKKPLPVFGTRYLEQPPPQDGEERPEYYSLNYFAQVTSVQVDFSPGNIIAMPAELPSLPEQHFALHLAVAAGVGFPPSSMDLTKAPESETLPVLAPMDVESVCKFPMEVVLTGYATRTLDANNPLSIGVDGFEIIDLQPSGMECLIESFVKMEVRSVIVPQLIAYLRKELPDLIYEYEIKPIPNISLPKAVKVTLTPVSEVIPKNPAFENDAVKVRAQLVEVVQWPS